MDVVNFDCVPSSVQLTSHNVGRFSVLSQNFDLN